MFFSKQLRSVSGKKKIGILSEIVEVNKSRAMQTWDEAKARYGHKADFFLPCEMSTFK